MVRFKAQLGVDQQTITKQCFCEFEYYRAQLGTVTVNGTQLGVAHPSHNILWMYGTYDSSDCTQCAVCIEYRCVHGHACGHWWRAVNCKSLVKGAVVYRDPLLRRWGFLVDKDEESRPTQYHSLGVILTPRVLVLY